MRRKSPKPTFYDPTERIHCRASELSEVTRERFNEVEDMMLEGVLTDYNLHQIMTVFYTNARNHADESFSSLFTKNPNVFEQAQNLSEFLIQKFGGQCHYSDRKGVVAMISKHAGYKIDIDIADKWLLTMDGILEQQVAKNEMESNHKEALFDYFCYVAFMLVAAEEVRQEMCKRGTIDENELDVDTSLSNLNKTLYKK